MRSFLTYISIGSLAIACGNCSPMAQKQPITTDLFNSFVRYTKFAAASIPANCPRPYSGATVIKDINEQSTRTQARLFLDKDNKEIILGFPGSSSGDKATNAQHTLVPFKTDGVSCGNCAVHKGYLAAWNSVVDQIYSATNAAHNSNPDYKIIITGHSLGGALSSIAYASLKGKGLPIAAAYTQGQPRLGNQAFANYIDKLSGASQNKPGNFFRLTHAADPIPDVLPQKNGWRHSRTEYWEQGKNMQDASTTFMCVGQEDPTCSNGVRPKDRSDHGLYSNVSFHDDSTHALCNT